VVSFFLRAFSNFTDPRHDLLPPFVLLARVRCTIRTNLVWFAFVASVLVTFVSTFRYSPQMQKKLCAE